MRHGGNPSRRKLPISSLRESAEQTLSSLNMRKEDVRAVSVHGVAALGYEDEPCQLLIILKGSFPPKFYKLKDFKPVDLAITVGEMEFQEDCREEKFGGALASLLLIPYECVQGNQFLAEVEAEYMEHVILESLQNLILDYRLASSRLLIRPEYFLFDKLRKLSAIHLPMRRLIRACFQEHLAESLRLVLPKYERALDSLASRGVLSRRDGGYTPSEKYVVSTASRSSAFMKLSRELEHFFKLYLNASLSSPIESLAELALDPSALKPPKIPDPLDYVERETALGSQSLKVEFGVKEFAEKVYGVDSSKVRVRRAASVLNSAYIVEIPRDGSYTRIFVKRYLNWTDFKWAVAWLWSIGIRNFSLLASIRMSNEIYFVNKLAEIGINTAEILHINWSGRMLFQRFVEGSDLVRALERLEENKLGKCAREVGMTLARIHENGISLGDCNPFNFLLTPDGRIYVVDLEQCSYDSSHAWDLAELLYYSARYLKPDREEEFISGLIEGYAKLGDVSVIEESMDARYARVLAPIMLPRNPLEFRERVMRLIRR